MRERTGLGVLFDDGGGVDVGEHELVDELLLGLELFLLVLDEFHGAASVQTLLHRLLLSSQGTTVQYDWA